MSNDTINDAAVAVTIRGTDPADLDSVEALLAGNDLPIEGVAEAFDDFIVADRGGELVGVIGLELFGDVALLRSAVVREDARGSGLGARLVHDIMAHAGDRRVSTLFLLTTTAEEYFPRFGFARIARDDVPAAIKRSPEFRGACPDSATAMRVVLGGV